MNYFRYERSIKEPKMECFDVCGGTAHAFFHSYNSVLPLKTKCIPYFIKVNFVHIQVFYLRLSDRPFTNFVKDKQLPRGTLGKKSEKSIKVFRKKIATGSIFWKVSGHQLVTLLKMNFITGAFQETLRNISEQLFCRTSWKKCF